MSDLHYTAFGEILDPASGSPLTGDSGAAGGAGRLPAGHPRFAYAGGWGYETPAGPGAGGGGSDGPAGGLTLACVNPLLPPIVLQHVGFRWYQPDTGRFVQRDPIGIRADFNVYLYAGSDPTADVDPEGLWSFGLGPDGPIFGRGRLRGGKPGILNRGNFRFGWSWHAGKNHFSLHGGAPRTPGHWHLNLNNFGPSGPNPAPLVGRLSVWCLRGGAIGVAFGVGYGVGTGADWAVGKATGTSISDWIGNRLWDIAGPRMPGQPGYKPY
jgi:hypothetical protein